MLNAHTWTVVQNLRAVLDAFYQQGRLPPDWWGKFKQSRLEPCLVRVRAGRGGEFITYTASLLGHDSYRFYYDADSEKRRVDEFLGKELAAQFGKAVRFSPMEYGYRIHESVDIFRNGIIITESGGYVHDPSSSLYDYDFVIEAPVTLEIPRVLKTR